MGDMELLVEEVGESSSPPRPYGIISLHDIKNDIYHRLVEDGNEEAVSNPDFRRQLDAHFNRLPPSYLFDINVDKAEDVLLHKKILEKARDPNKRPVFHSRFIQLEDLNLDVKRNADDNEDRRLLAEASSTRLNLLQIPLHEIIFSTVDRPKLLSQLSALLSDVGLNIREAHVFSTADGYSLDVFVVDGWPDEGTGGLDKVLEQAIARSERSLSGSSHSVPDKLLTIESRDDDWEIDRRLLKIGEKIASGYCGDLYRGVYLGENVAVKILKPEHLNQTSEVEFNQEVSILREVQHTNVVRFIGVCTKPPDLCIVTEYMPGGNLYDFLHKYNNVLELPLLLKFAIDICKGMNYLHQNNIIHRDLKSANLLLDTNNAVKVADFGVARFQNRGGIMTAETGTYRWMAPEVINHQPYDHKADVFSFAIVLWELATSKIPYDRLSPIQAALGVRKGVRPELPCIAHPRLLNLMQRCWEGSPAKRPSFSEIIVELEELLARVQADGETNQQEQGKNPSESTT